MARATTDQLAQKALRLTKRLSEKGESLDGDKQRQLKKSIKRAQRRKRSMLASARRVEERQTKKQKPASS